MRCHVCEATGEDRAAACVCAHCNAGLCERHLDVPAHGCTHPAEDLEAPPLS